MTDANGLVTEYNYNADGLVTSVVRKGGAETLASVSVAYDESARPVTVRDQDGRVTAFDRDEFGRVLKETFADGSEVAYTYDAFGRRTSVLDENGHRISFGWNRFGLSSRTTAENQLTDYVRDDDGLVTEVLSKQGGRTDRSIRNSYDEYGRLECVDYGPKESEKFTYDKWGRIASHTRGDLKTVYTYDHFGRLASQKENGCETTYAYDRYGSRTSRITRNRKGEIVSKETRGYDRYGRLAETAAFGSSVKYAYNNKGQLTSQTVNGELIEYAYTRRGQLAGKYLGGKLAPDASVEYEYAKNGQITARTANGVRQTYEYDFKGQLLGVKEGEEYVERYAYDKAGNMVKKVVRVRSAECGVQSARKDKTTTFTFDDANQLVSSTTDGITTRYEYDAAGRLVREGNRTYTYGYLDKVMSVRDGANKFTYTYHPDGQLASADYGTSSESFTWDGLALIQRGNEHFINEPHVGGGNPVVSSKGTSYFNDMLGTTVGSKSGKTYSAATLTAFGERLDKAGRASPVIRSLGEGWFTGKPAVAGLGHAFLMRNYRAGLGKWQTADPLGYPDGWNQLAYCNNGVTANIDYLGGETYDPNGLTESQTESLYRSFLTWITWSYGGGSLVSLLGFGHARDFLERYIFCLGDQNLAYSQIENELAIILANRKARQMIQEGNTDFLISATFSGDWYYALGRISIHYVVSWNDGGWTATATVDDLYDFNDKLETDMPCFGLGVAGLIWGWHGGDYIKDKWMDDLYVFGWASRYVTHISWTLCE